MLAEHVPKQAQGESQILKHLMISTPQVFTTEQIGNFLMAEVPFRHNED